MNEVSRRKALITRFEERYQARPELFVSAPGRTEIAGNHTDHNHGRVLAAAVTLDTLAAVGKNGGNVVRLFSEGFETPFIVDITETAPVKSEEGSTVSLIRGVAAMLKKEGLPVAGFDAEVTSNVLRGSGLSSSAAFEVLLCAIFDSLFGGWRLSPARRAEISKYVENVYFGKPSGLMDQMASSVGGLVAIDFKDPQAVVRSISYDFHAHGYSVCVVSAGGDHENLTAEYASIPSEMRMVANAMGRDYLREVESEAFYAAIPALKGKVPDRAILRAIHFFDEDARAARAFECLEADDLPGFLSCLTASGESSWKLLQNVYVAGSDNREMALALALSERMLKGRGAWRIHGGGFGGTILAFVPNDMLGDYARLMDGVFGAGKCVTLEVRPEGAIYQKIGEDM